MKTLRVTFSEAAILSYLDKSSTLTRKERQELIDCLKNKKAKSLAQKWLDSLEDENVSMAGRPKKSQRTRRNRSSVGKNV